MKYWYILFLLPILMSSQTDYSSAWEDFYSYNKVLDFYQDDQKIISLSENALFIYDKTIQKNEKLSSVNGLSGETTSTLFYSKSLNKIVIGYENGLIEIIDENRKIYKKPDITNFNLIGSKRINSIYANNNTLYLSTPFGIVTFDLETQTFLETYFIGTNSSEVQVNEISIFNNLIYAATENGFYTADISNPFLIDSNNWTKHQTNHYKCINTFNDNIYITENQNIYKINPDFSLTLVQSLYDNIRSLKTDSDKITATSQYHIKSYDINFQTLFELFTSNAYENQNYTANTANTFNNDFYIGTNEFGILKSSLTNINNFIEIHPEGPSLNNVFSISVKDNHLWVVYGGYQDSAQVPNGYSKGISHYNGTSWVNLPFSSEGVNYKDLVHVTFDPNNVNKVYVSSWGDGMLILENDEVVERWNHLNSGLELFLYNGLFYGPRVSSSIFDKDGALWIPWLYNKLKKYYNGTWSEVYLTSITPNPTYGLSEITIDQTGNKWVGSTVNGALVVNEAGTKIMSLTTNPNKGDLPENYVKSIAVDKENRVWIGTTGGLRFFNASSSMFDLSTYNAKPVKIDNGQNDGYGDALLGNQTIRTICVDGADNKWFGTDGSGVLCTNSDGKKTLFIFNKQNSPLPSNKILNIRFDGSTGKIYFATDKGIVAYNSKIAPYADHLSEVYAYPNPVKSKHEFVTIAGRNGGSIPYGTNVKIVDAAGKLVYETNVKEGQQDFGGKVVWNKTNMAGNKVASGVYVVLMYYKDEAEVTTTKIAIIN